MIKSIKLNYIAPSFLLISILLTSCKNENITKYGLNGDVKKVELNYFSFKTKFGKIVKDKLIKDSLRVLEFNQKGLLTDSIWSNGKYKKSYTYNKFNNLENISFYLNNKFTHKMEYKYDKNNKKLEIDNIDASGKLIWKDIYKIDKEDKNKTLVERYNNEGGFESIVEIINYNELDNTFEIKKLTKKYSKKTKRPIKVTEIDYYKNGKKYSSSISFTEGSLYETYGDNYNDRIINHEYIYIYDDSGKLFSYSEKRDYPYISNQAPNRGEVMANSSKATEYELLYFNYDNYNNWTTQHWYSEDSKKFLYLVEQKLTYY